MMRTSSICGVILAAGFSTRMGRDKALLPWPPVPEGAPAANTFLGAMIDVLQPQTDLVIVVAGNNAVAVEPVVYAHGGFLVVNPAPERGQFSSLQIGLHEVLNRGRDAAFLGLVDRPPVLPKTVEDIRAAFLASPVEVWAVVPEVQREGKPAHGHPILAGREMIEAFLHAEATATARDVEHQYQSHIRYIPVNDPRVAMNIDTPEDYARLASADLITSENLS